MDSFGTCGVRGDSNIPVETPVWFRNFTDGSGLEMQILELLITGVIWECQIRRGPRTLVSVHSLGRAAQQLTAFSPCTKMFSPPFLPFGIIIAFQICLLPSLLSWFCLFCLFCFYTHGGICACIWTWGFNRPATRLPAKGSVDVINVIYEKARNT